MDFLDKVKQKADEYHLQERARQLADSAEKAAHEAVAKAGEIAHDRRDSVASGLDKVAAKVDARTEGKYADKVARAKDQITKGVDKLAERRPVTDEAEPDAPAPTAEAAPESPDVPPASPAPSTPTDTTVHEPPL